MDLCQQSDVSVFKYASRFVIVFFMTAVTTAVILEHKKIKYVTVSAFSPSVCHEVMGLDVMILVF